MGELLRPSMLDRAALEHGIRGNELLQHASIEQMDDASSMAAAQYKPRFLLSKRLVGLDIHHSSEQIEPWPRIGLRGGGEL